MFCCITTISSTTKNSEDIKGKVQHSIGDELPAGVLKLAKVYLAVKRKLKEVINGDAMAIKDRRQDCARRRYALPRRRHTGGYRVESARGTFP
jgi:hypothetical protein